MSILLGQSPQAAYSSLAVFGVNRYGYSAISAVYVDTAATIEYINIKAARLGTSGNVTVRVYDTPYADLTEISGLDDGDPVTMGDLIGSKTVDSSGWSTALVNRTFTFGAPIELPDHGIYLLTVEHTTGDVNNCIKWAFPTGAAYTQAKSTDGGTNFTKSATVTGIYQTYGTLAEAPGAPTIVSPTPTGATGITLDETPLEWAAGDPAGDTYEIYFRESGDAWTLVGEAQAGVEWAISFGTLAYGTTYEWRIDATNDIDTTTGDTWSFTTISFDRILISYVLITGGSGVGPYDTPPGVEGTDWRWTGENNMFAVRRIVAAANSKIWYESI